MMMVRIARMRRTIIMIKRTLITMILRRERRRKSGNMVKIRIFSNFRMNEMLTVTLRMGMTIIMITVLEFIIVVTTATVITVITLISIK